MSPYKAALRHYKAPTEHCKPSIGPYETSLSPYNAPTRALRGLTNIHKLPTQPYERNDKKTTPHSLNRLFRAI